MSVTDTLLTGYAEKQCARRVHNEWDPTIESVPSSAEGDACSSGVNQAGGQS